MEKHKHNKGEYNFFQTMWNSNTYGGASQWIIIAIALIPLVLVQQVSQSMIEGISQRIIETDSYHLLFQPYQENSLSDDNKREPLVQKISQVPGVQKVFHEIRGIGILKNGTKKTGVHIRGINQEMLQDDSLAKYLSLIKGELSLQGENNIILGQAIARTLQVDVGETLVMLTTRTDAKNKTHSLPKISRNTVVGIISTGYEELDRSWVFVSIERAKSLIPQLDREQYLGVKIDDPFIIRNDLVKRSEEEYIRGDTILETLRSLTYDIGQFYSWYSMNYSRYALFSDTKRLLSMVMLIAVILAAVTLSSTMTMKVIDMEIDIAMLKGIGASPRRLEQQIFIQGFIYGVLGSIVGCILGLFLFSQINNVIAIINFIINSFRKLLGNTQAISILNQEFYLAEIPFHIYWIEILWIVLFVILLSVIVAWLPARKLRKISALKIIRKH